MKDAVSMHMLDCLQQLIDVELDARFGQVCRATLDGLIEIHLHELKHKR